MTVTVPKRSFNFDIEGRLFKATALSMRYLTDITVNPDNDTVDAALKDAMPQLTEEDYALFDNTTKERLYREIVKFTFSPAVTAEQRAAIMKEFNMDEGQLASLSRDALLQLNALVQAKKPDASKKKSLVRAVSMMIRNGHDRVMEYDYPFFEAAMEELSDSMKESIVSAAVSVRVAGASKDEWKKFVKENTPKVPTQHKERVNDHSKNIERLKRFGKV